MKVAQQDGFYLVPQEQVARLFKSIDYYSSEIKRLKISRDLWRDKYKEVKNNKNNKNAS